MKKLFFVMVLWFAPASAFAFDAAAANANDQRAWNQLIKDTDAILGGKSPITIQFLPLAPWMTATDRNIVYQFRASRWAIYYTSIRSIQQIDQGTDKKLTDAFLKYAKDVHTFSNKLEFANASRSVTSKRIDRMEREAASERMIDAMEENTAAAKQLRNQMEINELNSGSGISPTIFCRNLGGTTICN